VIGTEALQRWTSAWKDSFQRFADDLSAVVAAIRSRDAGSLRGALGRLPSDAREAATKIQEAGPPPPGLTDEANHLRGLVGRAAGLGPNLANDCTGQAGLACAADVATLLSVVGQMLDALKPFGVDIRFRVELELRGLRSGSATAPAPASGAGRRGSVVRHGESTSWPISDNPIDVKQVTATDAARRFSEVLDAIEHRGETFIVIRNGHPVARIGPAAGATGRAVKEFLRRHTPDPAWSEELRDLRASIVVEERDWTG